MPQTASAEQSEPADKSKENTRIDKCGVVMPISSIDGLSENHWSDVRAILYEAISDAGFEPNLVSNADDIGIIQKRIIQNLYENPVVVCDVSAKNPNVMFELGLRLAFDKPAIIVKDDKTSYTFDTSPIEHLSYPRDLRFKQIVEFKQNLAKKIKATQLAAASDSTHTTFLKHFGTFHVAKLDAKEVSADELILEELRELRSRLPKTASQYSSRATEISPDVLYRFRSAINDAAKRLGLTRKADIRNAKDEIRDMIVPTVDAPSLFSGRDEYEEFFNAFFESVYI